MGVRRNFSRRGQNQHFSYPFQVADDATQIDVHKTLHPFYATNKIPSVKATVANSVSSKKFLHRANVCYSEHDILIFIVELAEF